MKNAVLTVGDNYGQVWYSIRKPYNAQPYIMVTCLYVVRAFRGQGYGKQLLDKVKEVSRSNNLPLILCVMPLDNHGMTKQQLFEFYRKMGFVNTWGDNMIWYPVQTQQKKAA